VDLHQAPEAGRPTFISIGSWSADRGQDAPPHRHAGWKITYYRTGRIDSIVDATTYEVLPGDVLVLRPNAMHAEIAHTAYSNYYLLLDAPPDQPWPASCEGDTAHDIGWLLARMLREASSKESDSLSMTPALVQVLDLTLRRAVPGEHLSPMQAVVRSVERLYEENYSSGISIAVTARQVGVSPSSLRHYFASVRGTSPHEALQQVRLRKATALLRTSDLSLASIAERCGFNSASHLSRRVKAATGSSPGSLR
jgi:AraC-like DNA-binding protein